MEPPAAGRGQSLRHALPGRLEELVLDADAGRRDAGGPARGVGQARRGGAGARAARHDEERGRGLRHGLPHLRHLPTSDDQRGEIPALGTAQLRVPVGREVRREVLRRRLHALHGRIPARGRPGRALPRAPRGVLADRRGAQAGRRPPRGLHVQLHARADQPGPAQRRPLHRGHAGRLPRGRHPVLPRRAEDAGHPPRARPGPDDGAVPAQLRVVRGSQRAAAEPGRVQREPAPLAALLQRHEGAHAPRHPARRARRARERSRGVRPDQRLHRGRRSGARGGARAAGPGPGPGRGRRRRPAPGRREARRRRQGACAGARVLQSSLGLGVRLRSPGWLAAWLAGRMAGRMAPALARGSFRAASALEFV
mmetsp:Transcript_68072/g.175467  ORF Transcript_68072/g.175467 Transcript_68072/m.175467 type:complete len:367 (+) Transcript_68072:356-1456(+)